MGSDKRNGLIAKSRVIYGERLRVKDYNSLIKKHSVSQVVAELKQNPRYRAAMLDVNEFEAHRGQIEIILQKNVFDIYLRLFLFAAADSNDFVAFLIRKKEMEIILNTVMFINSGEYERILTYLPFFLKDYLSFDITRFAAVQNFDDLIKALEGVKYQKILINSLPNSNFRSEDSLDLEAFESMLYTNYYKTLLRAIDVNYKGGLNKQLREMVIMEIDLTNWSSAYRMKTLFNRSFEEIWRYMLPFGKKSFSSAMEKALFAQDGGEGMLDLLKIKFLKNVQPDKNIELSLRELSYRYFKKEFNTSPYGLVVMYALIQLLELERQNVTTIIEGVRYSISENEIERLIQR